MMIEEIKNFRYRKTDSFIAAILILSLVLSGCSGCSPSGIRERNKSNEIRNEIVRPRLEHRRLNNDSAGSSIDESVRDVRNREDSSKDDSISVEDGVTIVSWNLEDFGKSKSDEVISFIANTVRNFDIVAIQEVVAGYGGAQAVARLNDELNRKGSKWDYRVSDPTSGINSYKRERYAFLWKTSRVKSIGQPWLEIQYESEINREPFLASFNFRGKAFTIVSFHAITKVMQPETEIKYFKFLPSEYSDKNLIFSGDFNCPQSHTVFNPLKKMGYKPIFENQKTTLKRKPVNDEYLASEFDNIFYNTHRVNFINSGVIKFYESFTNLKEARRVSDHIPVWFQFSLN